MTDEHIKNCIECDGEVKRLIGSGMTPIFKGSGFYETDYRSSNYHSDAKKDSSSSTTVSTPKESEKKKPDVPPKGDKSKSSSSLKKTKKSK